MRHVLRLLPAIGALRWIPALCKARQALLTDASDRHPSLLSTSEFTLIANGNLYSDGSSGCKAPSTKLVAKLVVSLSERKSAYRS